MKIKKLISATLLCTILAGCSNGITLPEPPSELSNSTTLPEPPSNSPIPNLRTGMGTARQGIKTTGFECTDTGSYFMCNVGSNSWLLYADHGSDTVIKLCGRPDCNHSDNDCNAYFGSATDICYYDGFLYTYDIGSGDILRMNLDGTERASVYNTTSFKAAGGYNGGYGATITNGIFVFTSTKIDENGETISDNYYYKLDGTMNEPKADVFWSLSLEADGASFVSPVDTDKENQLFIYGQWDPDSGVIAELFKTDNPNAYGYIGTKARYYIEDGIIIEDSYTEGKKELIDTGLKGNYQLACFPDCMAVYEYLPYEDEIQGVTLDEAALYFYDWDYNSLGSVKINYQFNGQLPATGFICGETSERIILTDDFWCIPRYYINKSDLRMGNIEIHALNVPEL